MRITVVYEDVRMALDVKPHETVADVKRMIKSTMNVEATEDKKVGKYLQLKFGGAPLVDKWVLQDLGITSGSNLKCDLKTVEKPKLFIYLAYNHEMLEITEDIDVISMTVGNLRSMLSSRLGIPVTVFRLTLSSKPSPSNLRKSGRSSGSRTRTSSARKLYKELYDMNTLDYYGIEIGSKLTLDFWDGWNEMVMSAIAGHEKMVVQYFSWEKPIRYFQQRVALYIAAYYGHMGLATSMIKKGAKGHEPVGIHPYRKWCFESEHPEAQRCPLHAACTKGHLSILRLFVKHSPLCFITKDEQGKTPFQIVLRHRHRPCFEFLVARQWRRKTFQNFSFSITIFCRILQWCEKAKLRSLVMHGTEKSTFKGHPQKEGALVGTSVVVDGYSDKPANSVPYALIPKPPITSESMVFALTLTKRKLRAMRRRRSSLKIISRRSSAASLMDPGSRKARRSSADSSFSTSSSVSFVLPSTGNTSKRETGSFVNRRDLSQSGNLRPAKKSAQSSKLASNSILSNRSGVSGYVSSEKSANGLQLRTISEKYTKKRKDEDMFISSYRTASSSKFTNLKENSRKNSRISFQYQDIFQENPKSKEFQSFAAIKPHRLLPPPAVKKLPEQFVISVPESGIPLPPKSIDSQMRPFFYWSPYERTGNPVDETMQRFREYRGATPRQNAVQHLTVTSSFTEKPWLQQLRMAVSLTKRGVKKNLNSQHSVALNA